MKVFIGILNVNQDKSIEKINFNSLKIKITVDSLLSKHIYCNKPRILLNISHKR